MKTALMIFGFLTTLMIFGQSASADATPAHNKELLREIRNITRRCVTESRTENAPSTFSSHCPVLTADNAELAHIFAQGEWLTLRLVESMDADGGDLSSLVVEDSKGHVIAQKENVLSFGHILYAMAGAVDKF